MTFSPVALQQMLEGATHYLRGSVVASTNVIVEGRDGGGVGTPYAMVSEPVGSRVAASCDHSGVTIFDLITGRLSRGYDAALFTIFGLAGCLITFLVFFSVHGPASPNRLLLWLNPLCLLPLLLIWTKGGRRLLMWWQMINFVALIGMCVVWIAGIQACNSAFIPLIISDGVRSLFFYILLTMQHRTKPAPAPHGLPIAGSYRLFCAIMASVALLGGSARAIAAEPRAAVERPGLVVGILVEDSTRIFSDCSMPISAPAVSSVLCPRVRLPAISTTALRSTRLPPPR